MKHSPKEPTDEEVLSGFLIYRNGCAGVRLDVSPPLEDMRQHSVQNRRYLCALDADSMWRNRCRYAVEEAGTSLHFAKQGRKAESAKWRKMALKSAREADRYRQRIADMWALSGLEVPAEFALRDESWPFAGEE